MSRTQQKLQAMSAQESLIQEKKRMIEEKMRLENAKKQHLDTSDQPNTNSNYRSGGNNAFKNDGSFLEQFQKSHGQLANQIHEYQSNSLYLPPPPSSWLPPPPFPMPPLPFNQPPLLPPPPLPFLPPPDFLSKMFHAPPPPLPVPPPETKPPSITPKVNIKNEDLYDPLKVEEEDEEEEEEQPVPPPKPANLTFNIKKEPNQPPSIDLNLSSLEHEQQKHDNGGIRRHQVATTSTDLSTSSALWWRDEDDDGETDDHKDNSRKRKSRWSSSNVKEEPSDAKFMQQIHEATEKAKSFVAQLNEQMKLYPEGYEGAKMSDEQRGQYVEQKELQSIYQTMMVKRRELENVARQQQHQYEYDSDEEIDQEQGTWEHRLRAQEMDITREWAVKLTDMARGKHHIGDFMPPNELEKFMKTYSTLKQGQTPDVSDYREFKIQAENIGYRLLEKFGWKEGKGLGRNSQGIIDPINKGTTPINHAGLGQDRPSELDRNDDEYQMYRKRMMLAYRFRPNPLNNPRRDYY